ncbi:hypothetical protein CBLAS_1811 [Campylobacter blaseri]|uniref:Uncharacterized protein n=1 Tax=Campylobacter blaseri TaxID=2042961 RepID=A0A2P8R3M5_9BACT|nr:hypothetical protein CQ405_00720 [Campylobacter blaseri]PSM54572.1 hypothetical protein CRN67_00720 [Campylobacter blaseri]QKF86955.1 hypothetical protein CBLAS_1811 [Campylobacter blaseri]
MVDNRNLILYVRPDEKNNFSSITWREWLNNNQDDKQLLKACSLYKNIIYQKLYNKYRDDFYIF